MRILLDECVDQRLRYSLADHECQTAQHAGFAGLKNGALLTAAEAAGFEVLITTDQKMPDQQNMRGRRIALLVFCASTNRLQDLLRLIPEALAALDTIQPGRVVCIS